MTFKAETCARIFISLRDAAWKLWSDCVSTLGGNAGIFWGERKARSGMEGESIEVVEMFPFVLHSGSFNREEPLALTSTNEEVSTALKGLRCPRTLLLHFHPRTRLRLTTVQARKFPLANAPSSLIFSFRCLHH
jgi:hypothetical protein